MLNVSYLAKIFNHVPQGVWARHRVDAPVAGPAPSAGCPNRVDSGQCPSYTFSLNHSALSMKISIHHLIRKAKYKSISIAIWVWTGLHGSGQMSQFVMAVIFGSRSYARRSHVLHQYVYCSSNIKI